MGPRVPGWPLALFRIGFGLLYLDMALQKAPWRDFGWLRSFIETEITHPTVPAVAVFLRDIVLAHFAFFGWMTFLVEMALGLGLLLGLFTRLAGVAGVLWQVNIAIQAFNVPGEWPCFAFCGVGRIWGLDARLARHSSGGPRRVNAGRDSCV
jgi:hypothetical protein